MRHFLFLVLLVSSVFCTSQPISQKEIIKLHRQEDSMKMYGEKMLNDTTAPLRFFADSIFTKTLVRALKTPNSFYYPFDSLITVSHMYAPDSSFRIFSWQFTRYNDMWIDKDYYWQRGAIQMRTADGSLKLYPLHDVSSYTTAPQDSIRTAKNWIGSIYYNVLMNSFNGKTYYTLLGFDDNDMRSTKKWIDVLYFDDKGNPQFGGPFFSIPSGNVKAKGSLQARFSLEYKKDAKARMNFDKTLDMIVFDHLVPEDGKADRAYTYVPDGDYQGFKWVNGKWVLVDKIFYQKLEDGQAPMPMPIKDAAGKSDESKLMQQSEINRTKQKTKPAIATPAKKPAEKRQVDRQPAKEREESN